MKKHTTRFTTLALLCVPFLVATTSLAQTEDSATKTDTTEMTTNEITTTDTTQHIFKAPQKEAIEWEKITLKLNQTDATGIVSVSKSHEKFELADKQDDAFKDIKIAGHFKEVKNEFITVNETGEWTPLKAVNNEKVTLEYVFDKETQKELNEFYPDEDFSQPFKTEPVNLTFTEEKQETANISLEIVGGELKDVTGNKEDGKQLKVKVKNGSEVTGDFTAIDSKSFVLNKDGSYSIPKEARYEKLNQEVEFTLDKPSYDKLAALPENSGKTVEKTYKMTVTKKAQKDITIKFKNKGINTVVGGQGRFLLEDTVEGVKIQEIEKVKFKPLNNNEFLSIDELGNWKALKVGKDSLKPDVILDEKTMTALKEEFKDYDLNIESETLDIVINQAGGGTNGKKYAPTATLPQTGEEKLRFAGIVGVVILALVGIFFFAKRNKDNDQNQDKE